MSVFFVESPPKKNDFQSITEEPKYQAKALAVVMDTIKKTLTAGAAVVVTIPSDIYIVETRIYKHKQRDVLLNVKAGCCLNNHFSVKCTKQQEKNCFQGERYACNLGGVDKTWIEPDRTWLDYGSNHGLDHRKKVLKKKNPKKSNRLRVSNK